ncbi:MAG TPA: hypothetical protein VFS13_00560 [Steroidobacteraceae bacterium]|nr:hypothetical protein [Steroidobacteraceae bacterium]
MPGAAACYAADFEWWAYHAARVQARFAGRCYSGSPQARLPAFVTAIPGRDGSGLSPEPSQIHWGSIPGRNSTLQAMALAYAWGARHLVLIGADLGEPRPADPEIRAPHFFGDHPPELSRKRSDYTAFRAEIEKLVTDLHRAGVTCINASPYSVIAGCEHRAIPAH